LIDNTANKNENISKILVAIDGSPSSMDAAEDAIEIARKNKSQLIVLYVIDFYKYPYLISSTILAPTFGVEKYMKEKKEAEKWMETIREKYHQNTGDVGNKNLKTEIIEDTKPVAAAIVEYAESENVD
jgi:nucleotide-binding universal stress UspA family protein